MDIAGLLVVLAASSTYVFEADLIVGTSAVTTGCQYGVQYSIAGPTVACSQLGSQTAILHAVSDIVAVNTVGRAYLLTSAMKGYVRIAGYITTPATGGNFTIRHLKVTSGTSTVYIGSNLRVWKVA